MGKADRFTDTELEYIRAVYPELGPSEISRRLGRSLSAVKARIKSMGLAKEPDRRAPEIVIPQGDGQNTHERLIALREILKQSIIDAQPSAVAALCKEYRAVLHEIDDIENRESSAQENPLERIAKAIADGLQS